jgi:hypothetical protein
VGLVPQQAGPTQNVKSHLEQKRGDPTATWRAPKTLCALFRLRAEYYAHRNTVGKTNIDHPNWNNPL